LEEEKDSLIKVLHSLRRDYTRGKFDETIAKDNPLEQFREWFEEVLKTDFIEPNAMIVSTANKGGIPSARVVLLKKFDERGFVFYTNYESQKAKEIEENPNVSLLFYWDKLERQVRINGRAEKISREESEEYFRTRPYLSRIGAWASKQSKPLKSRFTLMREVAKLTMKFPFDVPLPPFWGGYRVVPFYYEFWQGRPSRLHDRIAYTLQPDGSWIKQRLYP
jgi:pyridoxamine 5'-phosphate oxidase